MCPSLSSCVGKPARASGASPTGELRSGVDELATRRRRALPSLRGLSSRPEPSASRSRLPPRGGARRDFPSRVSQRAAGGRAEEPKALPPALRNKIFTLGDLFCVLGAVA
ncbi:hypothetical protein C8J57DRAFT_1531230 [Mycena rebaudengoi]|nr:hypothetical protein C8J57DRAFT_1531230 [Mycena rebaudengoi]